MDPRVSWSVEGLDPQVKERAEAAARRAGLSLNDWLAGTIPDTPPAPTPQRPMPAQQVKDIADIHNRLDAITRQINQISQPARADSGVASQLNDAISRLDVRLSQIQEPKAAQRPMMASPPLNPGSLERAVAELTARQNQLSAAARAPQGPIPPAPPAPPMQQAAQPQAFAPQPPPAPVMQDLSGLEKQLKTITGQIEALQRPDSRVEESIAAFRSELANIRQTITEAMPRRAIESIEHEIQSLSRRIDDQRHNGTDASALAAIERALSDIHEVLHSLTPAEQLAGFDETIRNLGGKIDMIIRANGDSNTIEQLEGAISALRAIVSNVASNEALNRLSDDVHVLASKVDQFSVPDSFSEGFAALEQRIAHLTVTLENRPTGVIPDHSSTLETAIQSLSDRLDHLPVGNDSSSAFTHLEQRVSYLLERLEATNDHRANNLGRVEEGLHDILRHLERQSSSLAGIMSPPIAPAMDPAVMDSLKRELSEMRYSQDATDRHTQDSLEVVHNTLGHVVDRLAMIEGDLRAARAAPPPPPAPAPQQAYAPQQQAAPAAPAPNYRPELPNPVATRQQQQAPQRDAAPPMAPSATHALNDVLDLQYEPVPQARSAAPMETHIAPRPAIHADLPPDHPLEPGSLQNARMAMSGDLNANASGDPASTSSFIAAARRAAQAAAASVPPPEKAKRSGGPKTAATPSEGSNLTTKIRSLLVGASVVVIVLGSFKMAMTLLDGGSQTTEASSEMKPPMTLAPPEGSSRPQAQPPVMPSITSPTPIGRQSLIAPPPSELPFSPLPTAAPVAAPQPAAPQPSAQSALPSQPQLATADVTGSIPLPAGSSPSLPPAGRRPTQISIPSAEKLPDAIGGPALRAAALKGDPTAAYEVGVRYAEARGVVANYEEAAKWYDRAAQAGIVPAMFRIGTLYEKGLSVKKDLDMARKYYMAAADRGNAKAMHNLAVLDADGGGSGANYKGAAAWFRKAAERGVADSQYNLGILHARGIGVDQTLAESYKWFSLAAAQGDSDAATKRDDVVKRLDPQSLAAAKLAVQTFTPEPQPQDATTVATPPGGWDGGAPAAKQATPSKRAAR
jgi:localization factor PodJL